MGLPIIATDIRGNRQVVHHALNGLLVELRSPESIATAVAALLDHRDKWPTFGAAGIVLAEADYDQRTVIARTLAAYRGEPIPAARR